jgi:hypothetical protein
VRQTPLQSKLLSMHSSPHLYLDLGHNPVNKLMKSRKFEL